MFGNMVRAKRALRKTPYCNVKLRGKDHERVQQDGGWTMQRNGGG